MRKIIASILLATALMMGMTTTALAATSDGVQASEAETVSLPWNYVKTSGQEASTYPVEFVSFSVTEDSGNPVATTVRVSSLNFADNVNDSLSISLPSYSLVGTYNYTVTTETMSSYLGMTRTKDPIIFKIQVQAVFNQDHTAIEPNVTFYDATGTNKITELTTVYDHGSLTVGKTVSGNLGSREEAFTVKVTFDPAGKLVKNNIIYRIDGVDNVIEYSLFLRANPTTVELSLKHGDSVTFLNIPAGMTYTIEEEADGYTTTFSENDGLISADEADEVTVTNTKNASINTGMFLDNMPIVMAAAVAVAGVVALVALKRRRADR